MRIEFSLGCQVNIARLLSGEAPATAFQMPAGHWEHFDYGSDIGVRGFGATKAAAFEQAALGVTGIIADPQSVIARESVPIWCEAEDDELLLAAWLSAIVCEMGCRRVLFGVFHVELSEGCLTATAIGEQTCALCLPPAMEINGVTYAALRLARTTGGGWMAQAVIDI